VGCSRLRYAIHSGELSIARASGINGMRRLGSTRLNWPIWRSCKSSTNLVETLLGAATIDGYVVDAVHSTLVIGISYNRYTKL
jgi:hypothetical protein